MCRTPVGLRPRRDSWVLDYGSAHTFLIYCVTMFDPYVHCVAQAGLQVVAILLPSKGYCTGLNIAVIFLRRLYVAQASSELCSLAYIYNCTTTQIIWKMCFCVKGSLFASVERLLPFSRAVGYLRSKVAGRPPCWHLVVDVCQTSTSPHTGFSGMLGMGPVPHCQLIKPPAL